MLGSNTALSILLQLRLAVSEGWAIPLFYRVAPQAPHLRFQVPGNKGKKKEINLWIHTTINPVLRHLAPHNVASLHISLYQFQSVPKTSSTTSFQKIFQTDLTASLWVWFYARLHSFCHTKAAIALITWNTSLHPLADPTENAITWSQGTWIKSVLTKNLRAHSSSICKHMHQRIQGQLLQHWVKRPQQAAGDQHPSTTAHTAHSGCCRAFPLALEAHIQVSATPVSQLYAPLPCTKHQMLFKNQFRQLLSCNSLLKIPIYPKAWGSQEGANTFIGTAHSLAALNNCQNVYFYILLVHMPRSPHFLTLQPDSRKLLQHKQITLVIWRLEDREQDDTNRAGWSITGGLLPISTLTRDLEEFVREKGTQEKGKCFSEIQKKEKAALKMWVGMWQ